MTDRHLAHFNWATLRAPQGDPLVEPFFAGVAAVNAKAEASPGFVWRSGAETEEGLRINWPLFTQNPSLIASFSVWESVEDFGNFVFKTVHGAFLKRGPDWFVAHEGPRHALWWVRAGSIPTFEEAREKVEDLTAHGPSPRAFTFDSAKAMGNS